MTSKALATIGTGPMAPVLEMTFPTFRDYASRHGYDLVVGSGDILGRPPAWAKVPMIRRLLDAYDIVFWLDADAIILDSSADIVSELEDDDYQALVAHENEQGSYPNTGVWVLRGYRARALLDAMWLETSFINHEWWENAALMHLMNYDLRTGICEGESEWMSGTRWLPRNWNSHVMLDGIAPARIRHYAGQSNAYRRHRMQIDVAGLDHRLRAPINMLTGTVRLAYSGARRRSGQ